MVGWVRLRVCGEKGIRRAIIETAGFREYTEEGLELLAALVDAINTTWDQRTELRPISSARRAPRPLDIWTQLPQSNCKQCGEQTCLAFACSLLLQKRALDECSPLSTDAAFAERRAALEAMF